MNICFVNAGFCLQLHQIRTSWQQGTPSGLYFNSFSDMADPFNKIIAIYADIEGGSFYILNFEAKHIYLACELHF